MRRNAALCFLLLAAVASSAWGGEGVSVTTLRVPDRGIQPQVAVDDAGRVHLIYFAGESRAGDLYYITVADDGKFSAPLRVNSQAGSAIAVGNIRGAQLALGRGGRPIVAWMGSDRAEPKAPGDANPMLVARLADDGGRFEPQQNVITAHAGLDGGGSVAADGRGNVYVVWHGFGGDSHEEADRQVWVAHSNDDASSFAPEVAATDAKNGVCACCGLKAATTSNGNLAILYRTAREKVHRDMVLLTASRESLTQGAPLKPTPVQPWEIGHCVMSSAALTSAPRGAELFAAWETEEQVYFASSQSEGKFSALIRAPGKAAKRKHPAVAVNSRGEVLLAWTESMGWEKGGAVAWQVYDAQHKPIIYARGRLDGVPVWSLVAAYAKADNSFVVVY